MMVQHKAKLSNERNVFGIRFKFKRGWSYRGRILITNLPDYITEKLKTEGDYVTVNDYDHYTQYVNSGTVTASSKVTLIDFYIKRHKIKRCLANESTKEVEK